MSVVLVVVLPELLVTLLLAVSVKVGVVDLAVLAAVATALLPLVRSRRGGIALSRRLRQ
jgi:hypothetical protein